MTTLVEVKRGVALDDYAAVAHLASAVEALRALAARLVPRLRGRRVWMVNSTAAGGGVAELLPAQVAMLRELGVETEWVVIEGPPEFFALTKRLHNMVHGVEEPAPGAADRELYERVSRDNAAALARMLAPHDILVVHDPQPLAAGALVKGELGVEAVWRCHIGLDQETPATRAAWEFLRPYTAPYDRAVFSAPEYVPRFLAGCASVIPPSIDPLSHKNRELGLQKLVGILCDARLAVPHWPLLEPPFAEEARRLQRDGTFAPATEPEDIGALARPLILQVSRWDRLKGWMPLLEAFRILKERRDGPPPRDARHRRRLQLARLVLAGPDPAAIQDDPEARDVLAAMCARYLELAPAVQRDVALLTLPMSSLKCNALMVNALQRCATIVAQNSLREGFGLTAAEAMWKHTPVLASARACGLRHQVRDDVDGCLVPDPEDADALAEAMHEMLGDSVQIDAWGRNAQHRVHDEFLIFTELARWLRVLAGEVVGSGGT